MRLSFHGGMCCGIKHIFEMGCTLDEQCEALTKTTPKYQDVNYDYTSSDESAFYLDAPVETKLKRLDRYLEFLRDKRPGGIVEITLVTPTHGYTQKVWVPIIKERGFKEVTPEGGVYNTNSGNKVRVFHLYMER